MCLALSGELCVTGGWCWSDTRWLFLDQPLLTGRSPHLFFFLTKVQGLPLAVGTAGQYWETARPRQWPRATTERGVNGGCRGHPCRWVSHTIKFSRPTFRRPAATRPAGEGSAAPHPPSNSH